MPIRYKRLSVAVTTSPNMKYLLLACFSLLFGTYLASCLTKDRSTK
jgi:hypothetical protein